MQPELRILPEKKLVGLHLPMSLAADRTGELWRTLMPQRRHILHAVNNNLISMLVHTPFLDLQNFNPQTVFEKWAAVEVSTFSDKPDDMDSYVLSGGLYAVFMHRGGADTIHYIFSQWLPRSEYVLDNRPQLAIMGARYKGESPDSEEELWIPVKQKEL